jgi:hypothetical protein
LSHRLRVPVAEAMRWAQGESTPPMGIFQAQKIGANLATVGACMTQTLPSTSAETLSALDIFNDPNGRIQVTPGIRL